MNQLIIPAGFELVNFSWDRLPEILRSGSCLVKPAPAFFIAPHPRPPPGLSNTWRLKKTLNVGMDCRDRRQRGDISDLKFEISNLDRSPRTVRRRRAGLRIWNLMPFHGDWISQLMQLERLTTALSAVIPARWRGMNFPTPSRTRAILSRVTIWPYLWLAVLYLLALCAFRVLGR